MANEGSQTFHWEDDDLDDENFQIHGRTLLYIVVLFSFIILITFIFFLYARCVNRSRSSSAQNATTSSSHSRNSPPSSQPQGLDAATINSIPIISYHRTSTGLNSSETIELSECSICLGVFEEGEKVKVLQSCCHCYHCECVDKWLITHSSCPMCRTSVRVDSSVWLAWFNFLFFINSYFISLKLLSLPDINFVKRFDHVHRIWKFRSIFFELWIQIIIPK